MSIFQWLIFIAVALISFIPIVRIGLFNISKKYYFFKYLSISLFIWTIINFLRYVVKEPNVLYYLSLSIYPLIFVITGLLFIAILRFLEKPVFKIYYILFWIFFLTEIIISFTNLSHQLMLKVLPHASLVFSDFDYVEHGIFFYVHTVVCYVLLIIVISMIIIELYNNIKLDQDIVPFLIMAIGIIIGISLNLIHIFFYTFSIDPTYIAFVIIITLLYLTFYMRDLRLILEFNRNNFIIDNLREMYLIVNQRDEIIDASDEFLESFSIDLSTKLSFSNLNKILSDKAVIYESANQISGEFDDSKKYLHMQLKLINLPFFKYSGKFYLFYDETQNRKYINDINYVKSHDLMTDLFNRNYFEEIKIEIDNSKTSYTLAMFDVDGLKIYNDYLGHNQGDQLLINFANILKIFSKKYNYTAIRMGGDEFLLIGLDKSFKDVEIDIVNWNKLYDEQKQKILFSYGIASKENLNDSVETVFSRADNLMYEMKIRNSDRKLKLKESLLKK